MNIQKMMKKGEKQLNEEQFDAAIQVFENVIREDPHLENAWLLKVIALKKLGNYDEALETIKSALEINKKFTDLLFHKGLIFYELGKLQKAIEYFNNTLELNPNHIEAKRKLENLTSILEKRKQTSSEFISLMENGLKFMKNGEYSEAFRCLKEALSLNTPLTKEVQIKFSEALIKLGHTYEMEDEMQNAVDCYSLALNINPDYLEVCKLTKKASEDAFYSFELIKGIYNSKEPYSIEERINDFISTLKMIPNTVEQWHRKAILLTKMQSFEAALECYDRILSLEPNFAEALNGRGVNLITLKDFSRGLENFQKAIQIDPNNSIILSNLAGALAYMKSHEEALKYAQKAIELNPDNASAWFNIANILSSLKEDEQALKSFNTALKYRPNYGGIWLSKGYLLKRMERFQEAEEALRKAKELNPFIDQTKSFFSDSDMEKVKKMMNDKTILEKFKKDIWATFANISNKGVEYMNQGDYDNAIKQFDSALSIFPHEAKAWGNKAIAYELMKNYEQALKYFNIAIKHNSKIEEFWVHKIVILHNLGKNDELMKCIEEALSINPNFHQVRNYQRQALREKESEINFIKQENFAGTFLGDKLKITLRTVGNAIVRFINPEMEQSEIIRIRYTGYPEIIRQDIEILYSLALEEDEMNNISWVVNQFFKMFEPVNMEALAPLIETIPHTRFCRPEYEYTIKINDDEWIVEYVHHDHRGELRRVAGTEIVHIDLVNGYIVEDDSFWENCGKKEIITIESSEYVDGGYLQVMKSNVLVALMASIAAFTTNMLKERGLPIPPQFSNMFHGNFPPEGKRYYDICQRYIRDHAGR